MLTPYLVAALAMAVLTAAWLAVQVAWRRTFPEASADPDPLSERMGCGGCGRAPHCERTHARADEPAEETP
jgi:hypothetical protein